MAILDWSTTLAQLQPLIEGNDDSGGPVVIMMCGMAGSGKSTLARAIVGSFGNFKRISIDAIIGSRHGIYGVDYPRDKYAEYQAEADDLYLETLLQLLRDGSNVVLDRSFYSKSDRDQFKSILTLEGGRWILVYLKAGRDLLWQRICKRRDEGVNADSALEIDKALLDAFLSGFEAPQGEGEMIVDVS